MAKNWPKGFSRVEIWPKMGAWKGSPQSTSVTPLMARVRWRRSHTDTSRVHFSHAGAPSWVARSPPVSGFRNKLCMAMMSEVRTTTEKCIRWWNHSRRTHPPSQRNTSQPWSISRKTRFINMHHEATTISRPNTYWQARQDEISQHAKWWGLARTVSCTWGTTIGAHLVLLLIPLLTTSCIWRRSRNDAASIHIIHTTDTKPMPVKKMGGANTGASI